MKKRNEKCHRMLAFALSILVFWGTVMPNGIPKASAAAIPFAGSDGVSVAGASMTLFESGRLEMTIVFSGINDGAVQRGTAVVDGKSYQFKKSSMGGYEITCAVDAKDILGTREIAVMDGSSLVPLKNVNVPVVNGKVVMSGSDFLANAKALDEASGGEYADIYEAVINYGLCAKSYFDNNPTESPVSVPNVDLSSYEMKMSGKLPNGCTYYGSSLILEDSITIRHYFSVNSLQVSDPSKYTILLDGSPAANVGFNESYSLYYIDITGIEAWNIDKAYALTVSGDGNNFTLNYSALSYAYLVAERNTNSKLVSLVKSIYWYNKALKDYLNGNTDPGQDPVTPTPGGDPVTPTPGGDPVTPSPGTKITPALEPQGTPVEVPLYTEKGYVTYKDFGAYGDGVIDDYNAILNTHNYANAYKLPVKADEGAVYYVQHMSTERKNGAIIKTDTDWTGASFIIDDTELCHKDGKTAQSDSEINCWLFTIQSNYTTQTFTSTQALYVLKDGTKISSADWKKLTEAEQKANGITGVFYTAGIKIGNTETLSPETTKIEKTFAQSCLLQIEHNNEKRFWRKGDPNNAFPQQDIVVVDQNGNIDPKTPITWNYPMISKYEVHPIDETTLTVKGGDFYTKVNQTGRTEYVYRGIRVCRSNVVIDGVNHYLLDENEMPEESKTAHYSGFFHLEYCAYVTIKNCKLSSHRYALLNPGTASQYKMAPYDLYFEHSCCITMENITDNADINDWRLWGIMGTNFCKELVCDNCTLSRFDVHKGTTNATVTNSTIGVGGILLEGEGTALIENTTCYGSSFVGFRHDFGSSWHGDLLIKNCIWYPSKAYKLGENYSPAIVDIINGGTTYYGFQCYMPTNIIIDGFTVDNYYLYHPAYEVDPKVIENEINAFDSVGISVFSALYQVSGFNSRADYENDTTERNYPIIKTKKVTVRNFTSVQNKPLYLYYKQYDANSPTGFQFDGIEFDYQ